MLFEQKKIQIETLGEYLGVVRKNLNLTLEQVSKQTGIKLKFLGLLEKGEFKSLPPEVYVAGFLRQLSQFYAIDYSALLTQYKKERVIQEQLVIQSKLARPWYLRWFGKVVVTPKLLSFVTGLSIVGLTVVYLVWQVWSINKTPKLELFNPSDNSVTTNAFVEVVGQTDPGMTVTVNGQGIFVDNKGDFSTQIGIGPGPRQIVVSAENRFGKIVSQTLNVTSETAATPLVGKVVLKLEFKAAVNLNVAVDDQAPQTLNFNSGDSKTFMAAQKILVSTSDAGATVATLNGQILGPMGKSKEPLNNVQFYPQATTTPVAK